VGEALPGQGRRGRGGFPAFARAFVAVGDLRDVQVVVRATKDLDANRQPLVRGVTAGNDHRGQTQRGGDVVGAERVRRIAGRPRAVDRGGRAGGERLHERVEGVAVHRFLDEFDVHQAGAVAGGVV